jgi:phospholipid/cholesterol/gamma-HCH transport system substrate-binding protein
MRLSIESKARLALAAVVFLFGVAGLIWYFVASSRYATYQIPTQESVSGLIVDAPVEFHGVEVGKVKSIELTSPHSVRILIDVKKETPITSATIATIIARGLASRGFMGYVYISLEDVGTNSQPLAASPGNPFPIIRTNPSRSVNLDTTISQVNENVQLMTELLRTTLDKQTLTSLKESVQNLQQIAQTLAANNQKLGAIILNTEQASNQFKPLLKSSNDSVKALQTQILPESYKALAEMDALSKSLNSIAARISRDPSILIRGSTSPPGPGETK